MWEIGVNSSGETFSDNSSQSVSPPDIVKAESDNPPIYMREDCILRNGRLFDKVQNMPVNGVITSTFKSGELMSKMPYTNGLPHGKEIRYYKSGNLKMEGQYNDGKANGFSRTYYESGRLKAEATYSAGYSNGTSRSYYESGELWLELVNERGIAVSGYIYNQNGESSKITNSDLSKINSVMRTLK